MTPYRFEDVRGFFFDTNTTNTPKYASKEVAQKRIEKELSAQGVEYNDWTLISNLSSYYATVEQAGTTPSQAGFAEVSEDKNIAEVILGMKQDPFRAKSKAPLIGGIVAGVVVLAAIIALVFFMAIRTGTLSTQVNAEGWNKDTSTLLKWSYGKVT